jgi:hypothetical protein
MLFLVLVALLIVPPAVADLRRHVRPFDQLGR